MKVVAVLTAGRSASSLVAKGLHDAGCHMGDSLLGAHESNPYGHYEDKRLIELNIHLLGQLGAAWNSPPPVEAVTELAADPCAQALVDVYIANRSRGHDLWGMKDPRLVLTWPIWRERLADVDLHTVMVWRSPEQIARSIAARDEVPVKKALKLAHSYHERMRSYL